MQTPENFGVFFVAKSQEMGTNRSKFEYHLGLTALLALLCMMFNTIPFLYTLVLGFNTLERAMLRNQQKDVIVNANKS